MKRILVAIAVTIVALAACNDRDSGAARPQVSRTVQYKEETRARDVADVLEKKEALKKLGFVFKKSWEGGDETLTLTRAGTAGPATQQQIAALRTYASSLEHLVEAERRGRAQDREFASIMKDSISDSAMVANFAAAQLKKEIQNQADDAKAAAGQGAADNAQKARELAEYLKKHTLETGEFDDDTEMDKIPAGSALDFMRAIAVRQDEVVLFQPNLVVDSAEGLSSLRPSEPMCVISRSKVFTGSLKTAWQAERSRFMLRLNEKRYENASVLDLRANENAGEDVEIRFQMYCGTTQTVGTDASGSITVDPQKIVSSGMKLGELKRIFEGQIRFIAPAKVAQTAPQMAPPKPAAPAA